MLIVIVRNSSEKTDILPYRRQSSYSNVCCCCCCCQGDLPPTDRCYLPLRVTCRLQQITNNSSPAVRSANMCFLFLTMKKSYCQDYISNASNLAYANMPWFTPIATRPSHFVDRAGWPVASNPGPYHFDPSARPS